MNFLQRLLNLAPFFEAEGGAVGAAEPASVPSEPVAENDLMDDADWAEADKEADTESQPEPEPEKEPSRPNRTGYHTGEVQG